MDDPRGLARAAQEVARCIAQDKRPPRVRPSDGESHFGPLFTVANHRVLPPVLLQQYDSALRLGAVCAQYLTRPCQTCSTSVLLDCCQRYAQ